jgi:hypothetical protein
MEINSLRKITLITGLFLALLMAAPAASAQQAGEPVEFETIAKQWNSGQKEKQFLVIRSKRDWKAAWEIVNALHGQKPDLPRVKFRNHIVLAVFQGEKWSGGYDISIRRITSNLDGTLTVFVRQILNNGCPTGGALTQPYHLVKVKTVKEITFIEEEPELRDCR